MRKICIGLTLFLCIGALKAQVNNVEFDSVNISRIKSVVDTLTNPAFGGRGVETYKKLSKFLSLYYENIGLSAFSNNGYVQLVRPFQYCKFSDSSYLKVDNLIFHIEQDFIHSLFDSREHFNFTPSEITSELYFTGLPNADIDSVLAKADIKNKSVIVFPQKGIDVYSICYERGASAIIVIHANDDKYQKMKSVANISYNMLEPLNYHLSDPDKPTFTTIFLSPSTSAKILGIKKSKLKKYVELYNRMEDSVFYNIPKQIEFNIHREKRYVQSGNVIGYIQGKDTTGEHIIISAHYDHLGKNNDIYFPGANDNASGVSAMLEIARVLSDAGVKPKRSIVFIAFGLEENRLLGSKYYVDHPVFPLTKLKANINLDMVGRQDKYHDTIPDYIYALGPDSLSLGITELMDSINKVHHFTNLEFLDNYPNAKRFFSVSSDQVNFLNKGIPAVLINNGMHKDLHKPTDTMDKLNFETIENVSKLLLLSIWEMANQS
ncbi:MAG: M20/M25/M40 family metallo-hydrolase [Bacteroidales bacterium]